MDRLFEIDKIKVSEKLSFHFLSIDSYNTELKKMFDESIASICNGIEGDKDIEYVKLELKNWFENKEFDYTKKIGFIAEFICHFYLVNNNFRQYFIFKNLEETKSMKKGFDGLYQLDEEIWLYESKSSLSSTLDANHNSNISEAYNDIKKKIGGEKKDSKGIPIDPWTNALHHASLYQVNPDKTLIQNLNVLKKQFLKKKYEDIKNYNVIPSSTIYLEDRWLAINSKELNEKLDKLTSKYKYKKMNVICVNKRTVDYFIEYINE